MSKGLEMSTPPAAAVVLLSGDESSLALALHRAARRLRARGGRVTIVCPNPALARLLRLVFLNHSSEVVGSLDEAQPEWS